MYLVVESGRMVQKIITASGTTFAVAPTNDHTDGSWSSNHLYDGEFGINSGAIQLALRVSGTIYYIPLSLTGTVASYTGSGTANYITKWTGASSFGNSTMYDDGTNVGIGQTASFRGGVHINKATNSTGQVLFLTTDNLNSNAARLGAFAYSGTPYGQIGIRFLTPDYGLYISASGSPSGPWGGLYMSATSGTTVINAANSTGYILESCQSIFNVYGAFKVPLIVAGERSVQYVDAGTTGTTVYHEFWAQNVTGTNRCYARVAGAVVTNANGTEDGKLVLSVMKAGTVTEALSLLQDQTVKVHNLTGSTTLPVSVTSGGVLVSTSGATDADFTTAGGTITWGGTTAPSGSLDDRYSWNRVGNMVFFEIRLEYAVAGSALTSLILTLPSDMPTRSSYTGWGSSEVGPAISATVTSNISGSPQQLRAWWEKDGSGNFRITIVSGSGAYIGGLVTGFYFVA